MLQRDCLLRVRSRGGDPPVEVYHDRIREGVTDRLSEVVRRDRHLALATTLESDGADPDSLVRHFEAAGERERAGFHAIAAADRAAATLAFERAAEL